MAEYQPTRFGKYLLLEKLAVGGMAQLYRAKITGIQGFEKLIAIKTILPHLAGEKELLTSFIDEAKLAALLHHQNIVQIYDFGTMEDAYFIAMEYLLGKDLRHIFSKSQEKGLPISNEHALYITTQICSGLDYAHTLKDFQGKPLNIIHRDISPQNIFITYEGEVKIVDFGIAKAASQSTITQYGMIKGKIAYMSPEQASGQPIDHRSDIFSTGILLYEMVTGKRMFVGSDTLQILAKVSRAEFEPPEVARSGLPIKVYNILNKALMKSPEDRYQSCGEMLADLEECMFQLSLRPTPRGLSQYMKELFKEEIAKEELWMREISISEEHPPLTEGEARAPIKTIEKTPQVQKRRFPLYASLAVILIAIVVGLAFWFKGKLEKGSEKEAPSTSTQASVSKPEEEAPSGKASPVETKEERKKPSPKEEVQALRARATELIEKNPEEAKIILQKAIQIAPLDTQSLFQLGLTYMKMKDHPKAIEAYQKVVEIDPKFTDALFNLGYLYAIKKDYIKAEEMYTRVVILAPSYLDEALFNLGMVQARQGKREQSIENLERSLSVNPNNEMAKKLLDKVKKTP